MLNGVTSGAPYVPYCSLQYCVFMPFQECLLPLTTITIHGENFNSESVDKPELGEEARERLDLLLTNEALPVEEVAEKIVLGNNEGIEYCPLAMLLRRLWIKPGIVALIRGK
jgi:hypothetical protein